MRDNDGAAKMMETQGQLHGNKRAESHSEPVFEEHPIDLRLAYSIWHHQDIGRNRSAQSYKCYSVILAQRRQYSILPALNGRV